MADLRRIWWLASYPKSGSTWVRAFIAAYRSGALDINNMPGVVGDLNDYFHQVVSPVPIGTISLGEYLCIHPAALLHLSRLQRDEPVLVKTHNANTLVDRMPLIPVQLTKGVIYIIRHPGDVCISWSEHLGCSIDDAIDRMEDERFIINTDSNLTHILSSWSTHVSSFTKEHEFPVAVLRYEDLISDPSTHFRALLDYLGMEYNESRFSAALKLSTFRQMQHQERENGFGERKHQATFFSRGTAGHWREILTNDQIERIEQAHIEVMQRHGYQLSSNPAARSDQAAA